MFVQPPSNYSFHYISQWQISKPRAVKIRVWAYTVVSGLKKKNKKTYHGCSVYELVKVHVHNFHQNFFYLISNPSGLDLSAAHSALRCARALSHVRAGPEDSLLFCPCLWSLPALLHLRRCSSPRAQVVCKACHGMPNTFFKMILSPISFGEWGNVHHYGCISMGKKWRWQH